MLMEINCSFCGSIVYRDLRSFNESLRNGWKIFCSPLCLASSRKKQVIIKCNNFSCQKPFETSRTSSKYCSRSCAVSVNNKIYPKKSAVIKQFFLETGRIPTKKEFRHEHSARKQYGSWNNAIQAAGYTPNPINYANKQIALDNHVCDSVVEKIIDDWLYTNQIAHEIHVAYTRSHMSADFRINGIYIEYFGLSGQHKRYDSVLKRKRVLWKKLNLKVIEIYPQDLFPINKLESILSPEVLGLQI